MCGICGIFEYERREHFPRQLLDRMNQTIIHRGPDDDGVYLGEGVGLGFRRLSIIDVAGGHQPLSNEDGTLWVMLNGEIYNYPELRRELEVAGHRFATKSDTETVVHLYEEFGEDCFARLRGMFAIALWDAPRRRLLLARDRVGKKPLFYASNNNRVVFGSELKAILAAGAVSRDLDNQGVSDYFALGYIPAPKTVYRSIRKVRPGHYLVFERGQVRENCYWDLSFAETDSYPQEEWCERIRGALCEATRIRLMSDVPLGAFLSGGVDSSAVVATMSRLTNRPVATCSIGFEEKEYDEADYARAVAKQFSTDHYEKVIRPDATRVVDRLAWHFDEPFADSSAIPTYYVSAVARERVTVALGGDGGDENFAGYRRYVFDQIENRLRSFVPLGLRKTVFGPLGNAYPALAWAPRVFRAKATLQSLARTPLEGYFNSVSIFRPAEKARIFTPEFRAALGDYDSIQVFREHYDRAGTDDLLSRIQYVDIKTYLADDILTKVDRASMAVSLEVRAPILDHVFMELVARLPSSLKLRGGETKYIFKRALSPFLSNDVLHRPKQGFAIPLDRWFRSELKESAYETIFGLPDDVLDLGFIRKMWDQHQKKVYDRSAHLWAVLMYRKWQKAFLNGNLA